MFDKMKLWKSQNSSSDLRERVEKIKNCKSLSMLPSLWMEMEDGRRKELFQELPAIMRE